MKWIHNPSGTVGKFWLALIEEDGVADGHNLKAEVKFDGCIHLRRMYIDQEDDYIHICTLRTFIEELEELEQAALDHFGSDWPF